MNVLLLAYGGKSYYRPFHIQNNERIIDIQFGAKNHPLDDVRRVWDIFVLYAGKDRHDLPEKYIKELEEYEFQDVILSESPIESIWIIFEHGTGGEDHLYALFIQKPELEKPRFAQYAFDRVVITWDIVPTIIPENWIASTVANNQMWISTQGGTYYSDNSFDNYVQIVLMKRETTSEELNCYPQDYDLDCYYFDAFKAWAMPAYLLDVENDVCHHAKKVEFFWEGRITRKIERCIYFGGRGIREYYLDYWDNCVNPEWLAYKKEIGLEE